MKAFLAITSAKKSCLDSLIDEWAKKYPIVKEVVDNDPLGGMYNTIAGWWNLNQDWFTFECEIATDWRFVRPLFLDEEDWKSFHQSLKEGHLYMMVYYVEEKKDVPNGKEYIPHH